MLPAVRRLVGGALVAFVTMTCGGDGGKDGAPPNGEPAARIDRLQCKFHAGDMPALTVGRTVDDVGTEPERLPIQYVFVLMMENRSFDHYFGSFKEYLQRVPVGTGPRIAPILPPRTDPDPRLADYVGPDVRDVHGYPLGVDVPPRAYDLRDGNDQDVQDAILVPRPGQDVAPFNPTVAGVAPAGRCDKHYWRHANDIVDEFGRFRHSADPNGGEHCVADTCHEWWCSHMQWNGGRMDGFFQSNDGYYEGGEPKSGFPPNAPLLSGDRAMLYYDWNDIPFYYWLAENFGIADRYFSSLLGPTFPNRDYLYAATSRGVTSNASNDYGLGAIAGGLVNAGALGDAAANPQGFSSLYDAMRGKTPDPVRFSHWVHARYTQLAGLSKGSLLARNGAWFGASTVTGTAPRNADRRRSGPDIAVQAMCGDQQPPQRSGDFRMGYNDGDNIPGNSSRGFRTWLAAENAALLAAGGDPAALGPQCINPVNFIDPDQLQDVNGEDEHPPAAPRGGERVTWDVVDALMAAPEVWKRSVLFITWDEHGGLYDHVAPPPACPPDGFDPDKPRRWAGAYGGGEATRWADAARTIPRSDPTATPLDATDAQYGGRFDRYGVRVPLLVVSPWAKHGYISHYTYDHTSIVRFIEARFGLPALTARDANADPLFDFFDFSDAAKKLRGAAPFATGAMPPRVAPFDVVATFSNATGPNASGANQRCRDNFKPPVTPAESGDLGADVYDTWDWSPGKPPPCGYTNAGGVSGPSEVDESCGGVYTMVDLGPAHPTTGIKDPLTIDPGSVPEPGPVPHLSTRDDISTDSDDKAEDGAEILSYNGASTTTTALPAPIGSPAQVAALNGARVAAGSFVFCPSHNQASAAAVWTYAPGGPQKLLPLGSLEDNIFTRARAFGINDQNHVVGTSLKALGSLGFYYHAFFFDGTQMTDLGVLPNGQLSTARAVNNKDTVVGLGDVGNINHQHATMWIAARTFDIHPSFPCKSSVECGDLACVNGTCDTNAFISSIANAVDDNDVAAGDYLGGLNAAVGRVHAFAASVTAALPPPVRLPVVWERPLPPYDKPIYTPSSHASAAARDPKQRDVIVGSQECAAPTKSLQRTAVRWTLTPARDSKNTPLFRDAFAVANLDALVIGRGSVHLEEAVAVNASGDILATGYVVDANGNPGPRHVYHLEQALRAIGSLPQPPAIVPGVLSCIPSGFTAVGSAPPFDAPRGCDLDVADGSHITICGARGKIQSTGDFAASDGQGLTIAGHLELDGFNMVAAKKQTVKYSSGLNVDVDLTLTPN